MINKAVVSRRRFLGSTLALATAWQLRQAAWAQGFPQDVPICNTLAEQEVGPYYVANELLRTNIREGKAGVPLVLRLAVLDARSCEPLKGAAIDVWHCDALGLYAGFTKMNPTGFGPGGPGGPPPDGGPPNGPPPGFDPEHPENRPGPPEGMNGPPPMMKPTDQMTFLRGIQFTDDRGNVEFATVFPGFYMGRTNHIHFKVRTGGHDAPRGSAGGRTYVEGHESHVGQVFFPEELAVALMQHEPYSRHQIHRTTQAEDGIFQDQHGAASLAKLRRGEAAHAAGYVADLIVAVDPTKTPAPVGRRPGGPPRGGFRPAPQPS